MTSWTIHEVTAACPVTIGELSQWISRGHYQPSQAVRSGQRRMFDWRDLACLEVMVALRDHSLSIKAAGQLVGDLRSALEEMSGIPEHPGLFFLCEDRVEGQHRQVGILVSEKELCPALRGRPQTATVVDVVGRYQAALSRLARAADAEADLP